MFHKFDLKLIVLIYGDILQAVVMVLARETIQMELVVVLDMVEKGVLEFTME